MRFEILQETSLLIAIFFVVSRTHALNSHKCDDETDGFIQEGNIGESGSFKWLGILRVHLHKKDSFKIALTGIVLVKDKYAIANAEDIVRIPKNIFREDSKAMFIAEDNNPWYCKPKSFMTHPEYEYSTYTTIALIELDINNEVLSPIKPICWPEYAFNTSNHLYALGYTDEHQLLEKVIYKMQYVTHDLCDEFYNRVGTKQSKLNTPVYYECGYAVNNKKNCVWDNGMILASNSTGQWILIGFGVHGPGCAGPARFIDLFHYLPWIESSTDNEEVPDYMG